MHMYLTAYLGPNHARGVLLITKACKACDIGSLHCSKAGLFNLCLLVKRVEFEAVRPVDEVRCKGSPPGWCLGAPLQWPKWVWWVHLPLEGV